MKYGKTTCAYCVREDRTPFPFEREVPGQKYCSDLCRQYHDAELAGGPILSISRNHKPMSDYSDFRDLSITKAESDGEKEFKRVQRANQREALRNTDSVKYVNPCILYDFSGKVFRTYENAQEKRLQIMIAKSRTKEIYNTLLNLFAT